MTDRPPGYSRVFSDGRIQALRYRYSRGTVVRVVSGPHTGLTGRVDSAIFDVTRKRPGYHVQLSNERWVTVAWDEVQQAAI